MSITVKTVNSILDLSKLLFKFVRARTVKLVSLANNFVVLTYKSTTLTHSSSTIFLCVNSQPTIESSKDLKFAPYNFGYAGLAEHLEAAEIEIRSFCEYS